MNLDLHMEIHLIQYMEIIDRLSSKPRKAGPYKKRLSNVRALKVEECHNLLTLICKLRKLIESVLKTSVCKSNFIGNTSGKPRVKICSSTRENDVLNTDVYLFFTQYFCYIWNSPAYFQEENTLVVFQRFHFSRKIELPQAAFKNFSFVQSYTECLEICIQFIF